jgi:hypothetical protein
MLEETYSHVFWCTPVIPALGEISQKKHEFEANLGGSISKKKKGTCQNLCSAQTENK